MLAMGWAEKETCHVPSAIAALTKSRRNVNKVLTILVWNARVSCNEGRPVNPFVSVAEPQWRGGAKEEIPAVGAEGEQREVLGHA